MNRTVLFGTASLLLALSAPAFAGTSLTGECGLVRVPDAYALPPMSFSVAADYVASEDTFVPVRAEFGIVEGLEVGGNYWFVDTDGLDSVWGVNAKYRLPLTLSEGLGIAAGVNYQTWTYDADDTTVLKGYGVATYDAKIGDFSLLPTVGFSWETRDDGRDDNRGVRFFGGVLAMVLPDLGVGLEFISSNEDLDGEDAEASVWFGARYTPLESLTVQAGVLNNANVGGTGDDFKDYVFHVGAQYAFGFAR